MDLIRESKASTAEKRRAREVVATRFIESGESTRTEIMKKYEHEKKYMSVRAKEAVGDDPSRMAKWLDATKNQKSSMLASFYLSSDQIMLIRDRVIEEGEDTEEFYNRLDDAVIERFLHRELPDDELNYYLMYGQY